MSGDLVPDRRNLRASHEDREQVVDQLRIAAGDGRLTPEELDERLETALSARTYGDLEALLVDLPAVPGTAAPPAAVPAAKDVVQLQARSANVERTGAWSVPRRMEVRADSGNAVLDFTEVAITRPTLDLSVSIHSSKLKLIVPPGVAVDVDDLNVVSSNVRNRVRREPGTPIRLHITVSGEVRSGIVSIRGPRRTFWDWLFRRPKPAPSR